ncbi:hypothetical protein KW846_10340 [Pseudomonas sp. PDM32]|jgi:hypothetical protein|uniref:hypothetical protein n=1 Tax=Pseudomonas sp. PDM32 TaxID=2854768 RepID=UPI001C471C73|nr:hypothetical protein [Pseudomonas sp. PDM32]MBV7573087.1 hypothetical protein [Pseudomonas sp. PDM32]
MWITCFKSTGLRSVLLFWGMFLAAESAPAMSFLNSAAVSGIASQIPSATTVLPDKLNTLEESLADETQVKQYSFMAVRGQDVWIYARDLNGRPLTLEYNRDGNWALIPWGTPLTVSGLQPNQEVQVRISKKPSAPFVAGDIYKLEFGSAPYYADSRVRDDAGELPHYWATTQAYRVLNWSVRLRDSTGQPLEGATATLILNRGAGDQRFDLITDSTGSAAQALELGRCYGQLKSDPFWTSSGKYRYKWEVEYNLGHWLIQVQRKEASGVGGRNVPNVSFAHICYQQMLRS